MAKKGSKEPEPPSAGTLRKYGLTGREWLDLLRRQGGGCGVCGRRPPAVVLCIDHEHVRRWQKLKPDERRRHVRGIACCHCNHRLLGRFVTLANLEKVLAYLTAYAARKQATHAPDQADDQELPLPRATGDRP